MVSTERLIELLASVNGSAIDNDGGSPGKHIEELCHEAAERMRHLKAVVEASGDNGIVDYA